MPAGRPRIIQSPQEMEEKAKVYFDDCDKRGVHYTIPGIAYAMGFSRRQSFVEYGTLYKEFSDTVNRLRLKIETQRVEKALSGEGNPHISKFDLTNNFDYKDKTEQDTNLNVSGGLEVSGVLDKIRTRHEGK